jgi:hypothetical protein
MEVHMRLAKVGSERKSAFSQAQSQIKYLLSEA